MSYKYPIPDGYSEADLLATEMKTTLLRLHNEQDPLVKFEMLWAICHDIYRGSLDLDAWCVLIETGFIEAVISIVLDKQFCGYSKDGLTEFTESYADHAQVSDDFLLHLSASY